MYANHIPDESIVFCVDEQHLKAMIKELRNLNTDITKDNPDYIRTYATGTVLALAQQMALERRKQGDGAIAVFGSDVKQRDRPKPKSSTCSKGAWSVWSTLM